MANANQEPQGTRHGLSLTNFRRFEKVIYDALSAYPATIEIDWTVTPLRYTSFMARFRDALKAFRDAIRENTPGWGTTWWTGTNEQLIALSTLSCCINPDNARMITVGPSHALPSSRRAKVIGLPETFGSNIPYVSKNSPSLDLPPPTPDVTQCLIDAGFMVGQTPGSSATAPNFNQANSGLSLLETSLYSLEQIELCLKSYAVLQQFGLQGMPRLVVRKTQDEEFNAKVGALLVLLEEGYDVSALEETAHWVVM
jgi:hypothetical protein